MQGSQDNLWTPIGTESNRFQGEYDGQDNSVSNLYIDSDGGATGLFAYNSGTIKNLGVESGKIKGKDRTAALVGNNENGKIEMCYNKAQVEGEGYDIGGVCGISTNGEITKCYNTGNVTCYCTKDFARACGICGGIYATVLNLCYNTGNITTYTDYANCRAGGITNTSFNEKSQSTISNCYNIGTIKIVPSGEEVRGGSVAAGVVTQVEGTAIVENCYNIGETIVEGVEDALRNAGIAGTVTPTATVKNSYWLTGVSPSGVGDYSTASVEVYEKTASQMKNIASSLGSAFKKDTNNINNGYPVLSWQ